MISPDGSRPLAWWRQGCLWSFILLPLLVGLLVVIGAFREQLFPAQPTPERAPDPPAAAVRLMGGDSYGFGSSVAVIETVDGTTYGYQWGVGWETWSPEQAGGELDEAGECNRQARRDLTAAAGPLVDCLTGWVYSEWCPGPTAAYALAADGSIWRLLHLQSCTRFFYESLCACLLPAALVSVGLWLLVKWLLRPKSESTSNE